MRLSTRSRYGTRLILNIALHCQDGPVRIQDIADRQRISAKYLERIVQILRRAGYIRSKRGHKGGHVLARPLGEITVGAIVRILEDEAALVECVQVMDACPNAAECVTRRIWKEANDAMFERLDAITLDTLVTCATVGVDI